MSKKMGSLLVLIIVNIFLNKIPIYLCNVVPQNDQEKLAESSGFRYLKLIDFHLNPNSVSLLPKVEKLLENEEGFIVGNQQIDKVKSQDKSNQIINDRLDAVDQSIKTIKLDISELKTFASEHEEKISSETKPRSCKEICIAGKTESGLYIIKPLLSKKEFIVYCEMELLGCGWTVIQSRFDGSVNFNRSWQDYKAGFGNPDREIWLGLDHIYELTGVQAKELYIELEEKDGKKAYACYDKFQIGSEKSGYNLALLEWKNGTAGDSFIQHIGMKFSTFEKDQDTHPTLNCASHFGGGWWYFKCYNSHLNGIYSNDPTKTGIAWNLFGGLYHSLAKSRMLIR